MVVDTSIILAVMFDEPHGPCAADQLQANRARLVMSTVNLTEALIHLRDRRPDRIDTMRAFMMAGRIRFVAPDVAHAETAADARHRFPINLGDCFIYALAVAEDCPILTLDTDFRRNDRPVVLPP